MCCAGGTPERAGTPLASSSATGLVTALRPSGAGKRRVFARLFPAAGSSPAGGGSGGGCVWFGAGEAESEPPQRGRGRRASAACSVPRSSRGPRSRPRASALQSPARPPHLCLGALTLESGDQTRRFGKRPSTKSWPWEDPDPRPQETGEVPAQPWCPGPDHVWNHWLLDQKRVFQEEGFGFLIDRSPTQDSFPHCVTIKSCLTSLGLDFLIHKMGRGGAIPSPSGGVGFSEARRQFVQGISPPNFPQHPS